MAEQGIRPDPGDSENLPPEEVVDPPPPRQRARRERPPADPPTSERVQVGADAYDVPPAVAAQLRTIEQQQQRLRDLEQAQERDRAFRQNLEQAVSGRQPSEPAPIQDLWFSDPQAAYQRIVQDVSSQLERRYVQDQESQRFWQTFDQEHPEMARHRELVQFVLGSDQRWLTMANTPENRALLAQATREKVLGFMQSTGGSGGQGTRVPPVETGGSRRTPQRRTETVPEGPQNLTELHAQRQDARRKARLRIVGGG